MEKRIRSITLDDAKAVADIYAPFVSDNATSFEVVPPDASEMQRRIKQIIAAYPWLVFEGDRAVLGFAYGSTHHQRHAYQWSADVSVYIHASARNRGVGRALYTALFDILRRQGFFNAYAGITMPNVASVRLHESLGFSRVGVYSRVGFKFGSWHDVLWLHLRLIEEPVPLHDPFSTEGLFQDKQVIAFLHDCAQAVHLD
jgi:L-amino acid N-acyltransferase YncA